MRAGAPAAGGTAAGARRWGSGPPAELSPALGACVTLGDRRVSHF